MDSTSQIVWAMLFGAIGLGFFTYGKRQKSAVPFLAGIALFVFIGENEDYWSLLAR